MQIDVAERRQVQHPLRNDAAVADDDDRVEFERGELGAKFVVDFNFVGLSDGQSQLQSGLLDRRRRQLQSAAFGAIGLGYD